MWEGFSSPAALRRAHPQQLFTDQLLPHALMVEMPLISLMSFVKNGIRPQRRDTSSRSPVSRLLRMIGWMVVGVVTCSTSFTASRGRGIARGKTAPFEGVSIVARFRQRPSIPCQGKPQGSIGASKLGGESSNREKKSGLALFLVVACPTHK